MFSSLQMCVPRTSYCIYCKHKGYSGNILESQPSCIQRILMNGSTFSNTGDLEMEPPGLQPSFWNLAYVRVYPPRICPVCVELVVSCPAPLASASPVCFL